MDQIKEKLEALRALREYLSRINFIQFYRIVVTPKLNGEHPSWIQPVGRYTEGSLEGLRLAICLMLPEVIETRLLTDWEHQLAEQLADAGLLDKVGVSLRMGHYQLIAIQEMPLLIDARVNYPDREPCQVYIGPDSLQLASWAGSDISDGERCLDIGTGCGFVGLSMARSAKSVILTDISEEALRLAAMNIVLTGLEDKITLRHESCEVTLTKSERYSRVSFNPPYTAIPSELAAPMYAKGSDKDGLGLCRYFVEHLSQVLAPDGVGFVVANLLGDEQGPFFATELRSWVASLGLIADLFVDASHLLLRDCTHFRTLGAFLHQFNSAQDALRCQRLVESLYLDKLGACRTYSTILRLSPAGADSSSIRVYYRNGMNITKKT